MVKPTTTSDEPKGQLPIDIKAAPNDAGTVDITKKNDIVEALKKEEATQKVEEAQEETKTKAEEVVEAPKVEAKTFSQEDFDKQFAVLKGGYEGTVSKLKADIKALTDDLETRKRQAEEQALNDWVKSIEDDGGNVDVARKIIERERTVRKLEETLANKEAQLDDLAAKLSAAGKVKAADDLIKTHGLSEDIREELLKAEDLIQMENSALRLRLEAREAEGKQPEKVGNVVRASTKGMDLSKMSPEQRLGMLADEYDRTGEVI